MIKLIGYFYMFGAIVLLISSITNPNGETIGIADRVGLSWVPEVPMRLILSVITITVAYYYLRLTKIGFWLMILYSAYFLIVSSVLSVRYDIQPYIGNMIFSIVVLTYTAMNKRNFYR